MTKVTAILLGAGMSSRMGKNKMLMPFQETVIIQHTYNQLIQSEVDDVVVVGGNGFESLQNSLQLRERDRLVFNKDYQSGMTSSIQAGVSETHESGLMICLGDMPTLNSDDYSALIRLFRKQYQVDSECIILPSVNGKKGNPTIFSNYYRREILMHKEPNGCKSVIKKNKNHVVKFSSDQRAYLADIDTPTDYEKLIHGTQ